MVRPQPGASMQLGCWADTAGMGREAKRSSLQPARRLRAPVPRSRLALGNSRRTGQGCRPGQPTARHSLEHGNEEVEQQDVGEEQVEAEQGDCQPLGEHGLEPPGVALGALGLVGVCAIGAALVQAEVHTCHGGHGVKGPLGQGQPHRPGRRAPGGPQLSAPAQQSTLCRQEGWLPQEAQEADPHPGPRLPHRGTSSLGTGPRPEGPTPGAAFKRQRPRRHEKEEAPQRLSTEGGQGGQPEQPAPEGRLAGSVHPRAAYPLKTSEETG